MSDAGRREPLYGPAAAAGPIGAGPRREPLYAGPEDGRPELADAGPAHREPLYLHEWQAGPRRHREPLHVEDTAGRIRQELADAWHAQTLAQTVHGAGTGQPAGLAAALQPPRLPELAADLLARVTGHPGRPYRAPAELRTPAELADDARRALQAQHRPSTPATPSTGPAFTVSAALAALMHEDRPHAAADAVRRHLVAELADDVRRQAARLELDDAGPEQARAAAQDRHACAILADAGPLALTGRPVHALQLTDGRAFTLHHEDGRPTWRPTGPRPLVGVEDGPDVDDAHAARQAHLRDDAAHAARAARAATDAGRHELADRLEQAGRDAAQLADEEERAQLPQLPGRIPWPAPSDAARARFEECADTAAQHARTPGTVDPQTGKRAPSAFDVDAGTPPDGPEDTDGRQELADDAAARARACTCLHRAPDGPPCPIGGRPDAFHAHEWQCAECSARTRARMAGHGPQELAQDVDAPPCPRHGYPHALPCPDAPQDVEPAPVGPDSPGTGPTAGTGAPGRPAAPQRGRRLDEADAGPLAHAHACQRRPWLAGRPVGTHWPDVARRGPACTCSEPQYGPTLAALPVIEDPAMPRDAFRLMPRVAPRWPEPGACPITGHACTCAGVGPCPPTPDAPPLVGILQAWPQDERPGDREALHAAALQDEPERLDACPLDGKPCRCEYGAACHVDPCQLGPACHGPSTPQDEAPQDGPGRPKIDALGAELDRRDRADRADRIRPQDVERVHSSDCATHNGPALPPGPCDCGGPPRDVRDAQRALIARGLAPVDVDPARTGWTRPDVAAARDRWQAAQDGPDVDETRGLIAEEPPTWDELAQRVRDAGTWDRNTYVRRIEPATILDREPLHAFTDAAHLDDGPAGPGMYRVTAHVPAPLIDVRHLHALATAGLAELRSPWRRRLTPQQRRRAMREVARRARAARARRHSPPEA